MQKAVHSKGHYLFFLRPCLILTESKMTLILFEREPEHQFIMRKKLTERKSHNPCSLRSFFIENRYVINFS